MLDLHCHLLPGIDDGAIDLPMALKMASMAVDDGIRVVACTPHIYPGMYENEGPAIMAAIRALRIELAARGIGLQLVAGADVHLSPDLTGGIDSGRILTLAGSRYLLLEPPHHVAPPRFEEAIFVLMNDGIVPVITHPERLSWVEDHYDTFVRLCERGAWMQVTAGSLTGRFGKRARYWAERFVGQGYCMILATDAHDPRRRPPLLREGQEAAARLVGPEEAGHMVLTRPRGILANRPPEDLPAALFRTASARPGRAAPGRQSLRRLFKKWTSG